MNRIAAIAAGLCGLMVAGSAAAQVIPTNGAQQPLNLEGRVNGVCKLFQPQTVSASNASVDALSATSAEVRIDSIVDSNGVPQAASVVIVIPAICTQAHTLSMSSANAGLRTAESAVPGSGFRSVLDYTVDVDWAGSTQSFESSGGDLVAPIPDAAVGDMTVTIDFPGGGEPAVAGDYSDQIIVELGVAG